MPNDALKAPDVIVIGSGMAGMAAAIHLASAGLRVTCLEPESGARQAVGESLDWATPDLLAGLGFSRDYLLTSNISTYKRHVTLRLSDGTTVPYAPPPWLADSPFNLELSTLHVDREALDRRLSERVGSLGVNVIHDRAVAAEKDGRRVTGIRSASGERYVSRWYVDASGSATSLLARAFDLPAYDYGARKVAMWTYFTGTTGEGTTIYTEGAPARYFDWIWEIPISASVASVGYISSGESVKGKRAEGLTVEDILKRQLEKFPRFAPLLAAPLGPVHVTSFQCRSYKGAAGPNWVIAGEAASLADPITSNGVSAALRHAAEGSALIVSAQAHGRAALPRWGRRLYSQRVLQMGRFFNSGIEKLIYEPAVRQRIGVERAADFYIASAWSLNTMYSRWQPRGAVKTWAFGALMSVWRMSAWIFRRVCA